MKSKGLHIFTKPVLGSNERLEEDFTAEIFRRLQRTSMSPTPLILFFRPQSRPKDEFDVNIAPLLNGVLSSKDTIFVSVSNNTEKSDAYLDDTGFTFKLKVKFLLTEGRLDIDRNEEALFKLTDMLIDEYRFRKLEEGEGKTIEEPDTEMIEQLEEIRSQLKDIEETVTLLILNDFRSEYTTSLLSALDDVEIPYRQREMQATQFHAYKWNNVRIIDISSSQDGDLCEVFLDHVSKNGKLCIIIAQKIGSKIDLEDQKKRVKLCSRREEASWHIVITMYTAKDETQVNQELERTSVETKISRKNIHFVKICTDAQTDSCLNLVHLTVLKKIVDCVNTYTVPEQARRRWLGFLLFILLTVVLVPAISYALSTACVESVLKCPSFILNICFYPFKNLLHYASFI